MQKEPANEYQRAVDAFKRELLIHMLASHGGNRTRAARALGLQRTYLLRLMRHFSIVVPRAERLRAVPTPVLVPTNGTHQAARTHCMPRSAV